MSPMILSVCLLSSPLSPAELRNKPERGTLAYGLYAVRAAFSVREGMLEEEAKAILGNESDLAARLFRHVGVYEDLGLRVRYTYNQVAGKEVLESRVREVRFFSIPVIRPCPSHLRTRHLEAALK